jgi:hypothetical protein
MMKKVRHCFYAGITVFALLFAGGCAGSRTFLLNLNYNPPTVSPFVTGSGRPVTLTVYNIQDVRPERVFLGERIYRDGMVDFYKRDSGTVEQVVTRSVIKLMENAGFKVTHVNRYLDPDKEDFKYIPGDAAFGGKIEGLWVEAKTGTLATDTVAKTRLRIDWGIVKERTWISKTIEGTAQESDRPFYQPENAETKINEVFKDTLDKILKDESALREKFLQIK